MEDLQLPEIEKSLLKTPENFLKVCKQKLNDAKKKLEYRIIKRENFLKHKIYFKMILNKINKN
jgi:hypothetical protein